MKRSFENKREEALKRLKTHSASYKGTKLNIEKKSPDLGKEEFPNVPEFDQADIDVVINKNKRGDYNPKVVKKGDTREYNVTLTLPPMEVKWADLGENGNLGKFGNNDPSKAKFSVTLLPTIPDNLPASAEEHREAMLKRQQEAMEFVKKTCDTLMGAAYHDENTWKDVTKKFSDDKELMEGAQHSVIKTIDDDDGEHEVLSLNRRLESFQGEPNRPTFWINKGGNMEKIDVKYIPRGSLLMVQLVFRAYRVPGGRYGVSGDLGKHIVVVCRPEMKKRKKPNLSVQIPYFEFTA